MGGGFAAWLLMIHVGMLSVMVLSMQISRQFKSKIH